MDKVKQNCRMSKIQFSSFMTAKKKPRHPLLVALLLLEHTHLSSCNTVFQVIFTKRQMWSRPITEDWVFHNNPWKDNNNNTHTHIYVRHNGILNTPSPLCFFTVKNIIVEGCCWKECCPVLTKTEDVSDWTGSAPQSWRCLQQGFPNLRALILHVFFPCFSAPNWNGWVVNSLDVKTSWWWSIPLRQVCCVRETPKTCRTVALSDWIWV